MVSMLQQRVTILGRWKLLFVPASPGWRLVVDLNNPTPTISPAARDGRMLDKEAFRCISKLEKLISALREAHTSQHNGRQIGSPWNLSAVMFDSVSRGPSIWRCLYPEASVSLRDGRWTKFKLYCCCSPEISSYIYLTDIYIIYICIYIYYNI